MWPNPPFPVDFVTFTEETLNDKVHFLCSDIIFTRKKYCNKTYHSFLLVSHPHEV